MFEQPVRQRVWPGVVLALLAAGCAWVLCLALSRLVEVALRVRLQPFSLGLYGLGLVQLLYILPAMKVARRKGNDGFARGLLIGASVVFLLNAACDGILLRLLILG